MAGQAHLGSLRTEEEFFPPGVGTVTSGTPPEINRAMDVIVFLPILPDRHVIVALVTKVRLQLYEQRFLTGMRGMTWRALAVIANGRVNDLVIRVKGVARIIVAFKTQVHTLVGQ